MRFSPDRLLRRCLCLGFLGLSLLGLGCGGGASIETSQEVVRNQQSASSAWADAKANGTAKTGTRGGGGPGGSQANAYRN